MCSSVHTPIVFVFFLTTLNLIFIFAMLKCSNHERSLNRQTKINCMILSTRIVTINRDFLYFISLNIPNTMVNTQTLLCLQYKTDKIELFLSNKYRFFHLCLKVNITKLAHSFRNIYKCQIHVNWCLVDAQYFRNYTT